MNTDNGWIVDQIDSFGEPHIRKIKEILSGIDSEKVDAFLNAIKPIVDTYYAHQYAHETIPNAKQQKEYINKLKRKTVRFDSLANELIVLLEHAPFELRSKTREAGVGLRTLQANLLTAMMAMNDLEEPQKSRHNPETYKAAESIAEAFEKELGLTPSIYREGRCIQCVSILLNISIERAYSVIKHIFTTKRP